MKANDLRSSHAHNGRHYELRAASFADAEAIDEMLADCAQHYLNNARGAGEAVERLSERGSDPATDTALVTGPDGVAGFGHIWIAGDEIRCFARVRPSETGHGVGTALMLRLEARAAELATDAQQRRQLRATTWSADEAGATLMRGRGFTPLRYFLRMVIDLEASGAPMPQAPPDIDIGPMNSGEDQVIFLAWHEAFADHWGYAAEDDDTWWRERRDGPTAMFDPRLWLVARAGQDVVGFCLGRQQTENGRPAGYVSDLGVRPAFRGRGIGLVLLGRMLETFRSAGYAFASLNVDSENLSGALQLYRKAGMRPEPAFTIWVKDL